MTMRRTVLVAVAIEAVVLLAMVLCILLR